MWGRPPTFRFSRSPYESGSGGASGGPARANHSRAISARRAACFCGLIGSIPGTQREPVTGFVRVSYMLSTASLNMTSTRDAMVSSMLYGQIGHVFLVVILLVLLRYEVSGLFRLQGYSGSSSL